MGFIQAIEQCGYRVGRGIGHLLALPLDWAMRIEIKDIPPLSDEEQVMKYAIQCFGGPKDGHEEVIERDERPSFLYVWPAVEDVRMNKADGSAREALRARLGTLAYRFDHSHAKPGKPNDIEFAYVYDPKRNK